MTLFDYKRSRDLRGEPFYALLMAAFVEADSFNFEKPGPGSSMTLEGSCASAST